MTLPSTRKQFFAKLLGVTAAASVFPKLFGKTPVANESITSASVKTRRFEVRVDARSIARRVDSI